MTRRSKSRVTDTMKVNVRGTGKCTLCDAVFDITLYEGDTKDQAFARDHPQNGCVVKEQRAVSTRTA